MNDDGECPSCGSRNVEAVEGEYYTGVTSPDGGKERWRYLAMRCRECGAVEEL